MNEWQKLAKTIRILLVGFVVLLVLGLCASAFNRPTLNQPAFEQGVDAETLSQEIRAYVVDPCFDQAMQILPSAQLEELFAELSYEELDEIASLSDADLEEMQAEEDEMMKEMVTNEYLAILLGADRSVDGQVAHRNFLRVINSPGSRQSFYANMVLGCVGAAVGEFNQLLEQFQ